MKKALSFIFLSFAKLSIPNTNFVMQNITIIHTL